MSVESRIPWIETGIQNRAGSKQSARPAQLKIQIRFGRCLNLSQPALHANEHWRCLIRKMIETPICIRDAYHVLVVALGSLQEFSTSHAFLLVDVVLPPLLHLNGLLEIHLATGHKTCHDSPKCHPYSERDTRLRSTQSKRT